MNKILFKTGVLKKAPFLVYLVLIYFSVSYNIYKKQKKKEFFMISILNFFPNNISNIISINLNDKSKYLEEIRLRVSKPIILKFSNEELVLNYIVTRRRYT